MSLFLIRFTKEPFMLTIICAVAQNRGIGCKNRLLFHLSADLKRFKSLTTGHTIIMGRRTFDSLPKGALPNRRNIVLSHNAALELPGVEVFPSLPAALATCSADEEVFVIGGASVYAEAFPLSQRLCLTEVQAVPVAADVFFPEFDSTQWTEISREHHEADSHNAVPFDFVDYQRKA